VFHVKHSIFALASGQGRAGVSIIRISGPQAIAALSRLSGRAFEPRAATYAQLRHEDELIDHAVVVVFPAPRSFTGEDCVELHVHGSRAVLDRLYEILSGFGLRLAGPGEFSRRALENGKLDLTQAEAIADLVDAESEAQRRQALTQLDGGLKLRYEAWRNDLVDILARIEVYIDFPEEDLPQELVDGILSRIRSVKQSLDHAVRDSRRGRQIREGYRIVILGEPNAGKSSLFNALLRAEMAIVTPIAGTTRDVLEAQLRIGPYSVLLFDTAGLRDTWEAVEQEGIRRARLKGDEADLRIWVVDSSLPSDPAKIDIRPGDLVVFNKVDLAAMPSVSRETSTYGLSLKTGQGMEDLVVAVETRVTEALSSQTFPAATRQRHLERLEAASDHLAEALKSGLGMPELAAEHIRGAINSFEALFGRYDVEGVLDVVFSTFCIGK
jgi:tRNA modification GTPase